MQETKEQTMSLRRNRNECMARPNLTTRISRSKFHDPCLDLNRADGGDERVGKFREVGLLALYLAAPASDYMTGQVIPLDGGLTV